MARKCGENCTVEPSVASQNPGTDREDYYYTVAEVTQDVLSKSSHLGAGFLKNNLKQVQGLTSESTQY